LRTLILGFTALAAGALTLHAGAQFLQAAAERPSALYGLGSAVDQSAPLRLMPVLVTGLVQEVIGRPISAFESAVIFACILLEAVVVGVVFQLALAGRSFGLIPNSLIALAGSWSAMVLYDLRPGVEALADLDALVARGIIASAAAPAALILVKAFAVVDAETFLARHARGRRGKKPPREQLASAAAGRRPKGPSAERIRGALDRRKS